MPLDFSDCAFQGPALPEPFVKFELEKELKKLKTIPKTTGAEGRALKEAWQAYRRKLQGLASSGGPLRVRNHVIEPLCALMGYERIEEAADVQTREDSEAGGALLVTDDGHSKLRVWTTNFDEDLYAPTKRGRAYRFSHLRVAQRVLLASGERIGVLTNGVQLMLLISDPARPDSTVNIPIDPLWKRSRELPDSFLLFLAITSPIAVAALPDLVDKARLQQARVTKELRVQARQAIEHFIQEILDHPDNQSWFAAHPDREQLAQHLWHEGLVTVYRLLFILKLESSDDPARSFSFSSTSLWRNTFSPSIALAGFVRQVIDAGVETGSLLEQGLRNLFKMFDEGLECTQLVVKPLGGTLFGPNATPTITPLAWGERAVAYLFDKLLWTPKRRGIDSRERVYYGPLDVEDLGRVYEALLELEPGITSETMCRLRRQKLEVVVPIAQGERYRPAIENANDGPDVDADDTDDVDDSDEDEEESGGRGRKTKVQWIEAIPAGRFYLRVGLGRKASGSYYTPHSFVRFLVQETLGPQVAECSPESDPQPLEILKLKVLDPAMGSGHFLVEACRFLGHYLYEACRLCDDKALAAERKAEQGKKADREAALKEARRWRQRIIDLPDPNDELLQYLPSRSPEGDESGFSQQRAEALCRRLVTTQCIYGVDKNPLAVELAKLSLWLESHAEGMPLTFLDHRLIVGDSLTGPFWQKLISKPSNPSQNFEGLFAHNLSTKLKLSLANALQLVHRLDASVGTTVGEVAEKASTKAALDASVFPFSIAAAAWSGGVALGRESCDDLGYLRLLTSLSDAGELPNEIEGDVLRQMIGKGLGMSELPSPKMMPAVSIDNLSSCRAIPYDLAFPEVFYPTGDPSQRNGFDAVLANPPWDKIMPATKEFFASFDFDILDAPTAAERDGVEEQLRADADIEHAYQLYWADFEKQKRVLDALFDWQNIEIDGERSGSQPDVYRYFCERGIQLLRPNGRIGMVLPSAFHANEGATGIRLLFLNENTLVSCFSFENRRKLFEIDSRFKFAAIVAQRGPRTTRFQCAFYLHDDEWLFSQTRDSSALLYELEFVKLTGGKYWSFVELRDQASADVLLACARAAKWSCESYLTELGVVCGEELNKTRQARRFIPFPAKFSKNSPLEIARSSSECIVVFEGRNIWHFDDRFAWPPAYVITFEHLNERPDLATLARHYRFGYRLIASSTNERTLVSAVLCPGSVCTQSISIERSITGSRSGVLQLAALWNTFTLDFLARQKVGAAVNKFLLETLPIPYFDETSRAFLVHSATRLSCNHSGYEALWREQLGDTWNEPRIEPFTWPILNCDIERWPVRAAIDAMVADAYRLTRRDYQYILASFTHANCPQASDLCLAAFDELKQIGLEAFAKKFDPYWDIPLNENLPQPVIDLPIPGDLTDGNGEFELTNRPKRSRAKRK